MRCIPRGVALIAALVASSVWTPVVAQESENEVLLVRWTNDDIDSESDEHDLYEEATSALDERKWDRAITLFDRVAKMGQTRADGALYWKAWAESRAGRKRDAAATITRLLESYPKSRWTGDAKALEIELQRSSGTSASPDAFEDEDLKLIALYGIIEKDPERGVALVKKVLESSASLSMKEQALYLLAEAESSKAREILVSTAKGGGNPDLQLRAIRFLGAMEDPRSMVILDEIYRSSNDRKIREAIIEAWVEAEASSALQKVARSDADLKLRMYAVQALGAVGDRASLAGIYTASIEIELKRAVLDAMIAGDDDRGLEQIMGVEKNPELRAAAVQSYGIVAGEKAAAKLVAIFRSESDTAIREAVLDAFTANNSAAALIELAKSEKDPKWRRAIVERIASIDSKEAQAFLEKMLEQ